MLVAELLLSSIFANVCFLVLIKLLITSTNLFIETGETIVFCCFSANFWKIEKSLQTKIKFSFSYIFFIIFLETAFWFSKNTIDKFFLSLNASKSENF